MNNARQRDESVDPVDLGEYCRSVEQHLTRVNEGQIIRIAGTAFELVRGWAHEGIPLAIVQRGIAVKAERHREGRSKRPLRLEFCEHDVRALYDEWRRAVGVWAFGDDVPGESPATDERRRPSAVKQIDRAVSRLSAAAARLEQPDVFRDRVSDLLAAAIDLREDVRKTRGEARRALAARARDLDTAIAGAARLVDGQLVARAEADAAAELAPYRSRLAPAAWQRSVDAAADRLLRASCGLPVIDPAWIAPDADVARDG